MTKIEIRNKTKFRNDDLRAMLRACLKAVGYAPPPDYHLTVRVHKSRTRMHGRATLGESRIYAGLLMDLYIPTYEIWSKRRHWAPAAENTPADWWRILVQLTIHECMHLVGSDHKDMTEGQNNCTLPLPAWASSLTPLRIVEEEPAEGRRAAVRADRLEHAKMMLRKAETRAKRSETIRAKWERKVRLLQRSS